MYSTELTAKKLTVLGKKQFLIYFIYINSLFLRKATPYFTFNLI